MPNVTISVPEELKTEMDNYPEVSWSEICRNAISQYIAQRKNPTPKIELDLRRSGLIADDIETGYPTLRVTLKIHNKMDSEITVDRILSHAGLITQDGRILAIGRAYYLHRKNIGANSSGYAELHLTLPKERIADLKDTFKSTFDCKIDSYVYVDGFRNDYRQEVRTKIPIDVWNDVVRKTLKPSD